MSLAPTDRRAVTSAPLIETLAERWSPRSYVVDETIDEELLTAALEAARWAPSASNSQPWRFIVARHGSPAFQKVAAALVGFNQAWAAQAAVLIVAAYTTHDASGRELSHAAYDLGQAMAHLSIQAHADGLHAHTMSGFDPAAIAESFALPAELRPYTVTALGTLASPDGLSDETLRARETAPRVRRALDELLIVTD